MAAFMACAHANLVDRALRIAKVERTVTCIIVPNDVQELEAVEMPPRAHGTIHSGLGFSAPRVVPKEADLRRAAEVLNSGQRVAMFIGAGALQAADEVLKVAGILDAGIAKALLGKAALPDDLPFVTGSIGLLGTKPSWEMMTKCDTLASLSGNLATMCPGVPYAIAAKFAFPDRVAIALVGDGAMQMLGNNELITISKYWKEWSDPRLVVLVLNNRDLNQVTWEMRAMSGDPKYEASQDLPDFPFARYAEMLGLRGVRVDKPQDIGPAWDEALSADRPVIYEAYTDPNVPTLPPHISLKMAAAYSSALFKGDPEEGGIIKQTIQDAAATIFPHKEKK
jgi:thiamine pyrophosphate-dependent acetolactate synthase large subunit-like protein